MRTWLIKKLLTAGGLLLVALVILWGILAVGQVGNRGVGVAQALDRQLSLSVYPSLPSITIVTKDPWDLTPADLTAQRVVYNLLTKPGFRWLFFDIVLGLTLAIIGMRLGLRLVRWSQVSTVTTDKDLTKVKAAVAGTIVVRSPVGVIYQALESFAGEAVAGMQEYGLMVRGLVWK